MKVLSYNIYGIVNTVDPVPNWIQRQVNIETILNKLLSDDDIKVTCFQEVNKNNYNLLEQTLLKNDFKILEKFPMKTQQDEQYNLIAIRNENDIQINCVRCIPHGKDEEYKPLKEQTIDYGMSDYRTTVFVNFNYKDKFYLIGNVHADYISTNGKINGMLKTLKYMDKFNVDYKLVVGDMNMVSHMSEVYNILKNNQQYITLSRSKNFDVSDNSWHGYGTKEQVNVDFAFIEKSKKCFYDYEIIKQKHIKDEGSDHRPIIIIID